MYFDAGIGVQVPPFNGSTTDVQRTTGNIIGENIFLQRLAYIFRKVDSGHLSAVDDFQ